jgi:hypothetical protein
MGVVSPTFLLSYSLRVQVCELIEGLNVVDAKNIADLPSEQKIAL